LLTGTADALLRLVGIEPRSELAGTYEVDDIADMLELAGREGTIASAEQDLMARAIRFATRTAADAMVPWDQVVAVSDRASLAEMEAVAAASGHPRLPVLKGEGLAGFVQVLDLLGGAPPPLRPVLEVPPTRPLGEVFDQMRQHSQALGVVIGAGVEPIGILTLEDLLGELLD
jgi:CBS domain containing-hemolysin-like protein